MNKNEDTLTTKRYAMLSTFLYVFPNELLEIPPDRELDFTIELKPGT